MGRRRNGGRAVLWRKEREEDENTCIPTNMHSLALSDIFSVTTSIDNSENASLRNTSLRITKQYLLSSQQVLRPHRLNHWAAPKHHPPQPKVSELALLLSFLYSLFF